MQPLFAIETQQARWARRLSRVIALWCFGLLAYGFYLQHVWGLEPCPMCIVQRYALILTMVFSAFAAYTRGSGLRGLWMILAVVFAVGGAFVAARQSWLQWYPPEIFSCGRDFYGMIEAFPLQKVIPMLLKGSGDCTAVDWTFLGLSIANWSFINFAAMVGAIILVWWRGRRA
jgi:disulfide bond formation protein DsbB